MMDIKIEIGDNLFLVVENVTYFSGKPGYTGGRPEDCYEDEPPECDWMGCKLMRQIYKDEKEFDCDPDLANEYYEEILEKCKEELE
jgi:hypothetical protein